MKTRKEYLLELEQKKDAAFLSLTTFSNIQEYMDAKRKYFAYDLLVTECLIRDSYYKNYFPESSLSKENRELFAYYYGLKEV